MSWKNAASLLAASALTLSLAACGGGSASGVDGPPGSTSTTPGAAAPVTSSNAVPSSVQGTVAYGHPVTGGDVVAIDVNGNKCGSATTASDGTYSMNTTCAPGPVEFYVSNTPNNIPLLALAIPANANSAVSGTVNITPLTTLIVYDFLGTQTVLNGVNSPNSISQAVGFIPTIESSSYQLSGSAAAFAAISSAYQNAANQIMGALSQTLSTYGVSTSSGFDPVTSAFSANGQGIDAFFDAYPETVTGANNLQLGSSNPILSVNFSGSPSVPSTLSGGAAGTSTGGASSGGQSSEAANGFNCAPGSYCYAYLGKHFTLTQMIQNQQTNDLTQETCSGTIASTPTTVAVQGSQQTAEVALMSGSCSINGQTFGLTGQVNPDIINASNSPGYSFPPVETSDSVFSVSDWYPASQPGSAEAPNTLTLSAADSLGAVSGTLTIN